MLRIAEGQPCPLCEEALAPRALPDFSGDENPLRLTISGLPVLGCATGHAYFARRDLPLWLMHRLVEEEAATLPAGRASGLLFRRYTCGACGGRLGGSGRHGFKFELSYAGLPAFAVELALPVFRCETCGREQVRSAEEVRKLAPAALVHALKGAGIKSTG